jgi:hypothetical protein
MDIPPGLEDCTYLLMTGKYEVVRCESDGENYVFPKTVPQSVDALPLENRTDEGWSMVRIPQELCEGYQGWEKMDDFILHMRRGILPEDRTNYVGRFSYEPDTLEFLPSLISVSHHDTIRRFGSYAYNRYIRGIYIMERDVVVLKAYFNPLDATGNFNPYGGYDRELDTYYAHKTIEMLRRNGLTRNHKIIIHANNDVLSAFNVMK